jgi:hypothetical protein
MAHSITDRTHASSRRDADLSFQESDGAEAPFREKGLTLTARPVSRY